MPRRSFQSASTASKRGKSGAPKSGIQRRHTQGGAARGNGAPEGAVLRVGEHLWSCRPGFETHLAAELDLLCRQPSAVPLATGWVRSVRRPPTPPVFARQWLPVQWLGPQPSRERDWRGASSLDDLLGRGMARPWTLHSFAADTNEGRSLAGDVGALERSVQEGIVRMLPSLEPMLLSPDQGARAADWLVQAALLPGGLVAVGAINMGDAVSRFPGGFRRLRQLGQAPSRAALKLEEALDWAGLQFEPGEVVVDFGAAPGGWSWVALRQRARVVAVDPGRLRPDVERMAGLRYVEDSAFRFEPDEPVDWLLCDMAWRPQEVANLLAKWGRRHWARMLIANFKLPMQQKVKFVYEVLGTLKKGGWKGIRGRQLYHDRNEITVFAHH